MLGLGQGLAAIAEGELVGTAMWWAFGSGHASLGSIIVAPERQGAGIGKLLMQGLIEATRGRSRGLIATEEGAVDAEAFCLEQGLTRYDARLVAWLVRHHLAGVAAAHERDLRHARRGEQPFYRQAGIDGAAGGGYGDYEPHVRIRWLCI